MAQFYNLTGYGDGGEPWSTEHGTFVSYWCNFEGIEQGVLLNKKQGSTPTLGAVYGDLVMATSQKGNQYFKFKSSQVPQGVQRPQYSTPVAQSTQPQSTQPLVGGQIPGWFIPFGNMIEYIYNQMKQMDTNPPTDEEPIQLDKVDDMPPPDFLKVDSEEIAKIKTVFGE